MKKEKTMSTIIQLYSLNTDLSDFVDFNDASDFIKANYGSEARCKNIISTDLATQVAVDEITSNKMHPQLVKFIKKERLANYALVMDDTNISNCIAVYGMPLNQPIN